MYNTRKIIMGIAIAFVVAILVIVIMCIALLKFMPDSSGAFYIRDLIETFHGRSVISR